MRIAIEAQRIFRPNKHGMDFFALELIRHLEKLNDGNEYFVITAPGQDCHCLEESPNLSIVEVNCPSYPLWEQIALPLAVKRLGIDLLHCTSNTAPINCPTPLVLTLHDIIYMERKVGRSMSLYQEMGRYYRKFIVPRILKNCKKIVTVSQFECNCIRETLGLPEQQITSIYNGYNPRFHEIPKIDMRIVSEYTPKGDFLFFLGNTDPKKNTACTLKAYSIYLQKSRVKRPMLIADLKEEYLYEMLKKENIYHIKPYLSYPGYIDTNDMPMLYNAAFAFLYPSLRESFGIPILEAMACGAPVITSKISAMPEIAGDSYLLVDPTNPEMIADAILRLEEDDAFRDRQVAHGLNRVKSFSWEKTAEAYSRIYAEIQKEMQYP